MFKRGSLVWGKLNSFPWWPAIVINPEDCGRDYEEKSCKVWVFWFGDKKISQVREENLVDFKKNFRKNITNKYGKLMKKAIEDILSVAAKRHNFVYKTTSALFNWAYMGFKESTVISKRHHDVNELPNEVLKSLEQKEFKRKRIEKEESDSESDDEINEVIQRIRKGYQKLEETCIVCCKSQTSICKEHPYFIGGVCQKCDKNMINLQKFKFGKLQDFCIICDDGGNLIYCCNNLCLSSYCDLCINYLAGHESYEQIASNANWRCYLCAEVSNKNCLIKPRFKTLSKVVVAPSFPEEKKPIRVISLNSAWKLLEKKINVEFFSTDPLNPFVTNRKYLAFSKKEFSEVKADLICGSFFIPTAEPIDAKKEMLAFAPEFFKFLYRLDNAKFLKPLVFFILATNVELNLQMEAKLIRFLEVKPVTFKQDLRRINVWTNIPSLSLKKKKPLLLEIKKHQRPEEEIIDHYGDILKCYFKSS